ncbi:zinc-binding dehydrogenase [Streptomyces sp. G44]|uniref:MDR/zinc-dependent alcohol dehydrogenase-like family protein n=1 Tax=Streptomyces sp. G44 TaxID=2807632 RepID=UPI0019616AAB|nr:medium chain dehydrogenase/reductase family protein [Streptomyces sp. G44]MBM7167523.1 zinc-binding dehydrogenase [Streptomyces sp. G44]
MRVLVTDHGTGALPEGCAPRAEVTVRGRTLRFGTLERPDTAFRPEADYNRGYALLRVLAFSLTHSDCEALESGPPSSSTRGEFGTDFVGEVVAAGSEVPLSPGDHVLPVPCWPPQRPDTVSGVGLPAGASSQLRRLHHKHLLRVPPEMDTAVAATLPTSAISAYAMVHHATLRPGDNVLVMATGTPLGRMAVQAATKLGAVVHALVQSPAETRPLAELGVREAFSLTEPAKLSHYAKTIRGFDAVLAPGANCDLETAVRLCGFGARCVVGAASHRSDLTSPRLSAGFLASLATKNVRLLGRKLGEETDLAAAIVDIQKGAVTPVIEQSFTGDDEVAPFIHRTFDPERAGGITYFFEKG